MIWTELRCDLCGMRGPGLQTEKADHATDAVMMGKARDSGWTKTHIQGGMRHLCRYCKNIEDVRDEPLPMLGSFGPLGRPRRSVA